MDEMSDGPVAVEKGKERKYYPHLDMDSNQFPEISKLKVGKKVMLTIEVKPTRFSVNEKEGKEPKSSMCFEVLRVGMAKDQSAGMSGGEKVENIVNKMYSEEKE